MNIKHIYSAMFCSAFMLAGITNASAINLSVVSKPRVVLKEGTTQLCFDTQRNGEKCQLVVESSKAGKVKKVIQTDDFEGAPYSWVALANKIAYICAAGNDPVTQIKCLRLKIDLTQIDIDKAETKQLIFLFKAKKSGVDLGALTSAGTEFANVYAKIQGYLRLYAKDKWVINSAYTSSKPEVTSHSMQNSGIMSPMALDCGGEAEECVEDGGGGDDGYEGGGGGGGGGGGSEDTGGGELSGPGSNIDPVTGLPYYQVPVTAPLPVFPSNPSLCNVLGISCAAPTVPPPSPEWCETKRQECSQTATDLFNKNPNSLDGQGLDYQQRWRLTVRNCLARFDCHNY